MHVACKCVLKQLPADSLEAQKQWPYALALAAGEAVAYAKQHLDRCATLLALLLPARPGLPCWLVGSGCGCSTQRCQTSPSEDANTSLLRLGRFVCVCL